MPVRQHFKERKEINCITCCWENESDVTRVVTQVILTLLFLTRTANTYSWARQHWENRRTWGWGWRPLLHNRDQDWLHQKGMRSCWTLTTLPSPRPEQPHVQWSPLSLWFLWWEKWVAYQSFVVFITFVIHKPWLKTYVIEHARHSYILPLLHSMHLKLWALSIPTCSLKKYGLLEGLPPVM